VFLWMRAISFCSIWCFGSAILAFEGTSPTCEAGVSLFDFSFVFEMPDLQGSWS
jgi:hypothetical protein